MPRTVIAMCGRYASSRKVEELVEELEVDETVVPEPLAPDYNVAPTKQVYAVVQRPDAGRQLRTLRWGLVPSWAKDPGIGSRMINARTETVAEKPAFRAAFKRRRCLLPADGYYEWYETEQVTAKGKPRKQPFFISPADGGLLVMAGLFEMWPDPAKTDDDPDRWLWTTTVLTTSATDDVGRIHDRMPMMLGPDAYAAWLDPANDDQDALLDLLTPAAPGTLRAWPVTTAVGNVRNNSADLVEPLPAEETLLEGGA